MDDARLLRQIDACRPGTDDLDSPRLAGLAAALADDVRARLLFEKMQQLDGVLRHAVCEVAPPDGLRQRLLDRLAAATSEPLRPASPVVDQQPIAARPARRRRMLWASAIGLALAASLSAVLVVRWVQPTPAISSENLSELAMNFFEQEQLDGDSAVAPRGPVLSSPSREITASIVGSRPVDFLGVPAVAYDLVAPGGARAKLYVLGERFEGLPAGPLGPNTLQTRDLWSTAWQEGPRACVLVVPGSPDDPFALRQFFETRLPAA